MFIILIGILLISSILVLIAKRNKETFYIFSMCISLAVLFTGLMIYIAKKGGISNELQTFFFIHAVIKEYFQYFLITLDNLGFMVAIGRILFPFFVLLLAMHYTVFPWLLRHKWLKKYVILPPMISLACYYPAIFYTYFEQSDLLSNFTKYWIFLYLLLSVILFIYEIFSIQINFIRSRFILISSFVFSLTFLYILYFGQKPDDIYQFYISGSSIYYIEVPLSIYTYYIIVAINILLSATGFVSLWQYTNGIYANNREEVIINRKASSINDGTAMFVHGVKNQLLSNRVIHKRLQKEVRTETNPDINQIKEYTDFLSEQNEAMLSRIENLYQSIKTESIHLKPTKLSYIANKAIEKFHIKFPDKEIYFSESKEKVLADTEHLSEAMYNLLVNGQESMLVNQNDEALHLICTSTRQYVVIDVHDKGIGISKKEKKKIFDPFYSSKNSNHNWGMGLHYVRSVIKEHMGMMKVESIEKEGTHFYIILPKLRG